MGVRTTAVRVITVIAFLLASLTAGASAASAAELTPSAATHSVTAVTAVSGATTASAEVSVAAPAMYEDYGWCTEKNGGIHWPVFAVWPVYTHYYPWGGVMYEEMLTYRVKPDTFGTCIEAWQRWW